MLELELTTDKREELEGVLRGLMPGAKSEVLLSIVERHEGDCSAPSGMTIKFVNSTLGGAVAWWEGKWYLYLSTSQWYYELLTGTTLDGHPQALVAPIPWMIAAWLVSWSEWRRRFVLPIVEEFKKLGLYEWLDKEVTHRRTNSTYGAREREDKELGVVIYRFVSFSARPPKLESVRYVVLGPAGLHAVCDFWPDIDRILHQWGVTREGVKQLQRMGEEVAWAALRL